MNRRPVGVIAVAIVLGLGALFLIVLAFGSGILAIAAPHMAIPSNGAPPPPPGFLLATMLFTTFLYFALAGWSGATLVGLFRMRNWARISVMVIGGALVFFGVMGVLGVVVVQTALPNIPLPPNTSPAALRAAFAFLLIWSFALVAMGVWWLVYFALRSTREAFRNAQAARATQVSHPSHAGTRPSGPLTDFSIAQPIDIQAEAEQQPVIEPVAGAWHQANYAAPQQEQYVAESVVPPSRRPVSITIVAVLLLIGSFLALLQMASPAPLFFMSVVLSGWPAHLTTLMMCAVSGVAGLGLIKLQKPAWMLAMGFFCVYVVNGLSLLLPGGRARFANYMHVVMSRTSMGMPEFPFNAATLGIMAVAGALFAVAIGATVLFLLWRARLAFETVEEPQAAA